MNVKKSNLHKIIFVQSAQYRKASETEVELARSEFAEIGLLMETMNAETARACGKLSADGILFLSDDPAEYTLLKEDGCYVAAWLHAGNESVSFQKAPFLVSEPHWIGKDSYEKIYERLAGIPWTIAVTDRCLIREMTPDDTEAMYRIYDATALEYMPGPKADHEEEREYLTAYIEKVYGLYGYGYWAVALKDEPDVCIGRVGFEPYQGSNQDVSFGYLMEDRYRRQGLAFEVCQAALKFAQENLAFPGIRAVTDRNNTASIALLGKLGFYEIREQDADPAFATFSINMKEKMEDDQ